MSLSLPSPGGPIRLRPRAILIGLTAAAALLGVYLGIITLAQGAGHALAQLAADAAFIGPIAVGFGLQVAFFAELRAIGRHHGAGVAVTATGTGTSGTAMLACCAHHLVELLPLLGLSAAAALLEAYKTPLFVVGLTMNAVGVAVIGRHLLRAQQAQGGALACHVPEPEAAITGG
jgi:hypothetical protein